MTLSKITIDNSVKIIPQSEQTQSISKERDSKPKTTILLKSKQKTFTKQ